MSFSERWESKSNNKETFRQQFSQLRMSVHQAMKAEEELRLRENPRPSEDELYMGAFNEWLEPQVRAAVIEMNRKGYATHSSGFHGEAPELQIIDGHFTIDEPTKRKLEEIGVEVLRGANIGVPRNKLITMLRFRALVPSISDIKARWDAIASLLPEKSFPAGIRPISDRAEVFREQYAPEHPSLEATREEYNRYCREKATA